MKKLTDKQFIMEQQASSIKNKLNEAGIKVYSGKRLPKHGRYSGIVGESKKVLELKI